MELGLRGKNALVTGGSRGIGRAIARALAAEGVQVAICGRTPATLAEAARAIEMETGTRVIAIPADMRRLEDVNRFVHDAAERLGGVDILVNNAVQSVIAPLTDLRDEDLVDNINVKVLGYLRCIRAVIPHLRARGGGRIINIGGMAVRLANPGSGGTGLANAAITNFTKVFATQLGPEGILVNVIHPGGVLTDRILPGIRRRAAERGVGEDVILSEMAASLPIRRMVTTEDIANLTVFLCSDLASAITGQSIGVDGGQANAVFY